jgi:steroid 5-alpha reductase family enzyme
MSPLTLTVTLAAVACACAWIPSLITGDTSWVDRMWSIVPIIYVWVFASYAHLRNPRLDVMAALVTVWGVRLTYNFARKGGYSGVEDYRWAVLRASMRSWQFQLFNLFFIVLYQNALLVLIALPAWTAYQHRSTSFGAIDVLLTVLFLLFTVGETVADQQQWDFHQWKSAEVAAGRAPNPRFLQSGLFRFSPELFFRTGPVVGGVPLRRSGRSVSSRMDVDWSVPPDAPLRWIDAIHRTDLTFEVSGVRALPTLDVGRRPVVRAQRRDRASSRELTASHSAHCVIIGER